ncbi:PKD domain-containing protein, partial [Bacteroidales bacterium]|nr:PKD domain-containing protein [Bacteroidales bacterium]
ETYPFITDLGKLVFSSDREGGFGGLDIYYGINTSNGWSKPVLLDSQINSPQNDYSLSTNNDFASGFFISDRNGTEDIFDFKRMQLDFSFCKTQKPMYPCYMFFDQQAKYFDTISPTYHWKFSNGDQLIGDTVTYCFQSAGTHYMTLIVLDKNTGDTLNSHSPYTFPIKKKVQPFIFANDPSIPGKPVLFSALNSHLPETKIIDYFWNINDDGTYVQGPLFEHTFENEGMYSLQLGIMVRDENYNDIYTKCVFKTFEVLKE